ncbi:MAG: MliC family protein [Phycisphaerales bacterium]|nr:MliC family protein [Hyphomonadaceae bacterium]
MRAAVLVIVLVALAGCQTPCPGTPAQAVTSTFSCEDGSSLEVTFANDTARIVQEGYTTLELPARSTASGYRYADNGLELRSRGSEVRWTRPGAAETLCQRTP